MRTARMHRGAAGIVAGAADRPNPHVNRAIEAKPPRRVPHTRRAPDRARKRKRLRPEARQRTNQIAPAHDAGAGQGVPAISLTPISGPALGVGRSGGGHRARLFLSILLRLTERIRSPPRSIGSPPTPSHTPTSVPRASETLAPEHLVKTCFFVTSLDPLRKSSIQKTRCDSWRAARCYRRMTPLDSADAFVF